MHISLRCADPEGGGAGRPDTPVHILLSSNTYFDAIYCPEDKKPVSNNKNSKKCSPCAYVIYFFLLIYLFWNSFYKYNAYVFVLILSSHLGMQNGDKGLPSIILAGQGLLVKMFITLEPHGIF